jgi:hypothetical protein
VAVNATALDTTAASLRQERSARDFERCAATVAAFICLVMIRIMPSVFHRALEVPLQTEKRECLPSMRFCWAMSPMAMDMLIGFRLFRKQARECRRLATLAQDSEGRPFWLRLSEHWLKLAQWAGQRTS